MWTNKERLEGEMVMLRTSLQRTQTDLINVKRNSEVITSATFPHAASPIELFTVIYYLALSSVHSFF
jgi:hypothetical protein